MTSDGGHGTVPSALTNLLTASSLTGSYCYATGWVFYNGEILVAAIPRLAQVIVNDGKYQPLFRA